MPYVKPSVATRQLGIDRRTLKKWADDGFISYIQPGGRGQRLYDLSSVNSNHDASQPSSVSIVYGRVITRKQLPKLYHGNEQNQKCLDATRDAERAVSFERIEANYLSTAEEIKTAPQTSSVAVAICASGNDNQHYSNGIHKCKAGSYDLQSITKRCGGDSAAHGTHARSLGAS